MLPAFRLSNLPSPSYPGMASSPAATTPCELDGIIGGPRRQDIGDFVWQFSTRVPSLVRTSPENEAEGVSTANSTIQIFFSDPIASQTPSNFQLFDRRLDDGRGPDGAERPPPPLALVPITGFGAEGDTVISFSPVGGLRPFSEYKVLINREVLGPLATSGDSLIFRTAGRLEDAASGGVVRNPSGSVEVYFPPNAVDADAEVVIRRLPDEIIVGKVAVQDDLTPISPAYEVTAGEATLAKPVTLTMRFSEDEVAGVEDLSKLAIFVLENDIWVRVGGTPEADEGLVRTSIRTFGTFAIFEDLTTPTESLAVRELDCQPRAFSPGSAEKPETDISFTLSAAADVTVRVYNASGRLERVIERDRAFGPDRHLVTWNGLDEDGDQVAIGLYIVVVNAGGAQAEKVVAVVR